MVDLELYCDAYVFILLSSAKHEYFIHIFFSTFRLIQMFLLPFPKNSRRNWDQLTIEDQMLSSQRKYVRPQVTRTINFQSPGAIFLLVSLFIHCAVWPGGITAMTVVRVPIFQCCFVCFYINVVNSCTWFKNLKRCCPAAFSVLEQKNPLLQLKESGVGIGRMKRRYKRKNAISPVKKGPSPLKRNQATKSPAKIPPPSIKAQEPLSMMKVPQ